MFAALDADHSGISCHGPVQRRHRANPSTASGFADFMDSEDDAFAELLRRSAQTQANRRGNDLEFELSIEFIESIAGANKRPPVNGQHAA